MNLTTGDRLLDVAGGDETNLGRGLQNRRNRRLAVVGDAVDHIGRVVGNKE